MQKQILDSDYEHRQPCVMVSFIFEKLDPNAAKEILRSLNFDERAEVYHGDHPQIPLLYAHRTGAEYHAQGTSVVIRLHYDFHSDLWHNPHHLELARKAVRADAEKLVEMIEFSLSAFDK